MRVRVKNPNEFNALLIRKGYSKSRFSKIVGISSPMFVQISNGDRCPSPETAKRISDALELEWDELFVLEDAERRERKEVAR
jgi:DNA-binding XRE family transcriptional regulator